MMFCAVTSDNCAVLLRIFLHLRDWLVGLEGHLAMSGLKAAGCRARRMSDCC